MTESASALNPLPRSVKSLTLAIKRQAAQLGFIACSVAAAEPLPETQRRFEERIDSGLLDGLPWMDRSRAKRATNPDRLLAEARTIISLAAAYDKRPAEPPGDARPRGRIARYAWGRDYHRVLEHRARALCRLLDEAAPGSRSRVLVDYGPLAERAYAARAGLGWFGKNTNLLLPEHGSWILLAEIITTATLDPDLPLLKSCGACRRCVDACPTGALVDGYVLDNQLCIAYQTIENRGPIPRSLRPLIGDWLFGCDLCQEVCPVGHNSRTGPLSELTTGETEDRTPALIPLLDLTDQEFSRRFAGRAIMRAKRDGLVRNACVVLGNLGDPQAVPALIQALSDRSALVRGHAAWALGRLATQEACAALQAGLESESDDWVREEIRMALDEDPEAQLVTGASEHCQTANMTVAVMKS